MKYEQIKTDDLIPYARNAKKHSEAQVNNLVASIREFGFINPVIIDKDNGIIAGHGRVMAAHKMQLKTVPCLRVEHLTETQKRAYILADNRLAEQAEWDKEVLKIELDELKEMKFDFSFMEFDFEDEKNSKGTNVGGESIYTTKIESPVYKPTLEKPPGLEELCDRSKTDSLLKEISASSVPKNIKTFLINAAQRHLVFNYENIAEYYAHAPKEVQRLMEKSALVIIDFNQAIENGFVTMTKELAEKYKYDKDSE